MTQDLVLYETDAKVGFVTLNRPEKLNALSTDLRRELVAGSSSARVSVAASSRRRSVLRALSFSGRFNVTKPTFASVS